MEVRFFTERNKSKNRVCCAVRDCTSKANKNLNVVFHKFPKAGNRTVLLENSSGKLEEVDKYEAWKEVLKIDKVTAQMRICSLHFKKTDYILPDYNSETKCLKKTAVPSCNLPNSFGAKNSVRLYTNRGKVLLYSSICWTLSVHWYIYPNLESKKFFNRLDKNLTFELIINEYLNHQPSTRRLDIAKLRTDMENFLSWKMVGGLKKMKDDVVPHKYLDSPKPQGDPPSEKYYAYKPVLGQVYTLPITKTTQNELIVEPLATECAIEDVTDQCGNLEDDMGIKDCKSVLPMPIDDENNSPDNEVVLLAKDEQKAPSRPRKYAIVIKVYKLSNLPKNIENEESTLQT